MGPGEEAEAKCHHQQPGFKRWCTRVAGHVGEHREWFPERSWPAEPVPADTDTTVPLEAEPVRPRPAAVKPPCSAGYVGKTKTFLCCLPEGHVDDHRAYSRLVGEISWPAVPAWAGQ